MKGNLKKILPLIFSILLFSSIYVIVVLKNNKSDELTVQLSPENNLYKEKFRENKSYTETDISTDGAVRNIRINTSSGVSEPKIVCNPLNKNILAVSANNFNYDGGPAVVFISEDVGLNWQQKKVPLSSKIKKSNYSDPWIDYDAEGNLFFSCVQIDRNDYRRKAIYLTKSKDNGTTWNSNLNFIDYNAKENISIDRPAIYVDKISSGKNMIYSTWREIDGLTSYIMFARSSDGGNTFSPPVSIEKNDVGFSSITGDHKGEIFLSYLKYDTAIILKKSIDMGSTWNNWITPLNIRPAGKKSENQFLIKNSNSNGIRINSEPSMTVSKDDDLLLVYSASGTNENDVADVFFSKLISKSIEMTKPVRVNSDRTVTDQFFPSITTDENNNIVVVYNDSRNDKENLFTESFASISVDRGQTFQDTKLSTRNFNPLLISVNKYIGDYNSCIISGNNLIGVWTDGRNNSMDIYAGTFDINEISQEK